MLQKFTVAVQLCNKIFQTKLNIFQDFSRTFKDEEVPCPFRSSYITAVTTHFTTYTNKNDLKRK